MKGPPEPCLHGPSVPKTQLKGCLRSGGHFPLDLYHHRRVLFGPTLCMSLPRGRLPRCDGCQRHEVLAVAVKTRRPQPFHTRPRGRDTAAVGKCGPFPPPSSELCTSLLEGGWCCKNSNLARGPGEGVQRGSEVTGSRARADEAQPQPVLAPTACPEARSTRRPGHRARARPACPAGGDVSVSRFCRLREDRNSSQHEGVLTSSPTEA